MSALRKMKQVLGAVVMVGAVALFSIQSSTNIMESVEQSQHQRISQEQLQTKKRDTLQQNSNKDTTEAIKVVQVVTDLEVEKEQDDDVSMASGLPICKATILTGSSRIERDILGFGPKFDNTLLCHELCQGQHQESPVSHEQFTGGSFGVEEWKMGMRTRTGNKTGVACDCLQTYECDFATFSTTPVLKTEKLSLNDIRRKHFTPPSDDDNTHAVDVKNLVIGHAQGYSWGKIEAFVVSLRKTGFTGGIHLRVNEKQQTDAEWMRKIKCYDVVLWQGPPRENPMHPQKERWVELADYITKLGETLPPSQTDKTSRQPLIIVADIRDSFFQANPFVSGRQWLPDNGKTQLLLFPECKYLGSHSINLRWTTSCWSEESKLILEDWWYKAPIICSGGLIGTFTGVLLVVKTMADELSAFRDKDCLNTNGKHDKGMDQGFMNHLFYQTNKLQPEPQFTKLMPNGVGPMAHISCWADWKIGDKEGCPLYRDPAGRVLGYDEQHSIIPMIHQYDRLGTVWKPLIPYVQQMKQGWKAIHKCD